MGKRKHNESDSEEETDQSKEARAKRREERKKIMALLPKVDENGIAYTKIQLRRMRKRVKRGLDPIESEQEKQERLKSEAELKRQEERELLGEDEPEDTKSDDDKQDALDDEQGDITNQTANAESSSSPSQPKTKRAKPVPEDYVCSACQNKHKPIHWIYDCPDKITVKGTNQVAKKLKGIHQPDSRKVFVSGLPFTAKHKDVISIFSKCGKILHCKLHTFEDSKRCKGTAILAFETDEQAQAAFELSGETLTNESGKTESARSELKLKVSKVLNRKATKKNQ